MRLKPAPKGRADSPAIRVTLVGTSSAMSGPPLGMCGSSFPQVLRAAHHGVENLVVVLAAAEIAGDAVRQLGARGVGILLEEAHRRHNESRHAERALKALVIHHRLLD